MYGVMGAILGSVSVFPTPIVILIIVFYDVRKSSITY